MKTKKPLFEQKESYLHLHAKRVLADWLSDEYVKIVDEEKFCMCGHIWFVPDLTCYTEKGIKDLYEVVYTSYIDLFKLWRMHKYFDIHKWDVNVFTISAEWIMRQTKKPVSLELKLHLPESREIEPF